MCYNYANMQGTKKIMFVAKNKRKEAVPEWALYIYECVVLNEVLISHYVCG